MTQTQISEPLGSNTLDDGGGSPATDATVVVQSSDKKPWSPIWTRVLFYGLTGTLATLIWTTDSREAIGGYSIALLLVLLFMKMPIGFSMIAVATYGLFVGVGERAAWSTIGDMPYEAVASWSLSVLPMFILMGMFLWQSGINEKVYDACRQWLGWMPGGLAVGTTLAGAGLSAVSGSTLGTVYALARIGIPEMLKSGYDRRIAVGSVLVSGTTGQLIPPGTFFVIYAGIAGTAVGPQLMAGMIPGILISVLYSAFFVIICTIRPEMGGRGVGGSMRVQTSWRGRWQTLLGMSALPIMAVVVLGGMLGGIFTATEAGAAGAVGSFFLMLWVQRSKWLAAMRQTLIATLSTCASIFVLVIGAFMLTRLLSTSGISQLVDEKIATLGLGRLSFLFLLIGVFFVMGMFMDSLSIMLLTVPVLLPTLETLDISLIFFGVFVVLLGEIGALTPPVGMLAYIVHAITRRRDVNVGHQITLTDTFVAVAWLLPVAFLTLLAIIFFPWLSEWLPSLMDD